MKMGLQLPKRLCHSDGARLILITCTKCHFSGNTIFVLCPRQECGNCCCPAFVPFGRPMSIYLSLSLPLFSFSLQLSGSRSSLRPNDGYSREMAETLQVNSSAAQLRRNERQPRAATRSRDGCAERCENKRTHVRHCQAF